MRCCLINPLYGYDSSISYSPPLGLAYIASVLEKNGHDVMIIDRVSLKYKNVVLSLDQLDMVTRDEIIKFKPKMIGIGLMTIQLYDTRNIVNLIRNLPNGGEYFIATGGFHPTAEPELTLKECPGIDVICRGEGELCLLELASGANKDSVRGLTYFEGNHIYSTPDRNQANSLDDFPPPARHLLDMEFYCRPNDQVIPNVQLKVTTMITSRGCPFNCNFCAGKLLYKHVRYHSPEYVIRELESIMEEYGVEAISFVDTMFLSNKERTKKILNMIINKNIKIKWACSARVDSIDREILALMKKAGCIYINFGLESGSQKMLDAMNKKAKISQNREAVKITNEAGILVNSAFIINIPGETEDDIRATIEFIKNNDIYCSSVNNLLPLPGSPFYKEFLSKNIIKYDDNLWYNIGALPRDINDISINSDLPKDRFIELYQEANRIVNYKNNKSYILKNWYKNPKDSLNRAILLMRQKILNS